MQGNRFTLKLCDFGTAKPLVKTTGTTKIGTFNYIAVELLGENPIYTAKSDIWSMGCIFFKICTGEEAFPGRSPVAQIQNAQYNYQNIMHQDTRDIIGKMIIIDSHKRFNDQDLQVVLHDQDYQKHLQNNNELQQENQQLKSEIEILKGQLCLQNNGIQNQIQMQTKSIMQQNSNTKVLGSLMGLFCEYKKKSFDYEGEILDGKANGKGKAKYKDYDGAMYQGSFVDNKREGYGVITWNDGDKYDGQFKNDMYDGYGIYSNHNGERYEGQWILGDKTGQATFYYKSGNRCEGQFKNGKRDGFGVYYFNNGNRFEGQFKNDQYDGFGIYYYKEGDKYEGTYKNGEKNGFGIYYEANGSLQIGEFRTGKSNGNGLKILYSGDKLYGTWVEGEYSGRGVRYFTNRDIGIGDYKQNKREGMHVRVCCDGTIQKEIYNNDNLKQIVKVKDV